MLKTNTNSTINLTNEYADHSITNLLKVFPQLKNLIFNQSKSEVMSQPMIVDKFSFYQIILEKMKSYFELKETFIISDSIGIILKDIKSIIQHISYIQPDKTNNEKKIKFPLIKKFSTSKPREDIKNKTSRNYSIKSNGRGKLNNSKSPSMNQSFKTDELNEGKINYIYLNFDKKEKPKLKLVHFADIDSDIENAKSKIINKVTTKKSNLKKSNLKKKDFSLTTTFKLDNIKTNENQIQKRLIIKNKTSYPIRNKSNGLKLYDSYKSKEKMKKSSSNNLINYSLCEKNLNELFNIDDKDFDILEFDIKVGKENTLSLIGKYVFNYFNFGEIINESKYNNWCKKITEGYIRNNSYHTDLHAADITHTSYIYFKEGLINETIKLDNSSICAIFLSCICHDYKHPGVNNNYLIETNNLIALNYNDKSVLENMHISETFKLIFSDKNCNIFENFEKENYKKIRKQMISCVLNTDMSFHKNFLDFMNKLLNNQTNESDTQNYMDLIVHTADISNPTKTFSVYYKWAKLVVEEFYQQGDKEKGLGLNCSCDRDKVTIYKSQLGFIDYIEIPYFDLFVKVFPKLNFLVENLKGNRQQIVLLEEEDNKNKEKKK